MNVSGVGRTNSITRAVALPMVHLVELVRELPRGVLCGNHLVVDDGNPHAFEPVEVSSAPSRFDTMTDGHDATVPIDVACRPAAERHPDETSKSCSHGHM